MSRFKSPVLFVGHGSPMNAIAENDYTRSLTRMKSIYPQPRAILCVSAHWMTKGTWVTAMEHPKTIHDFYGFPEELFAVQYPAPGSSEIARLIQSSTSQIQIQLDEDSWGLDHGAWSVLRHLYPEAQVPVLQLSLDMEKTPEEHFRLGERLRHLRDEGIYLVGSGNLVHNLRQIKWDPAASVYPWAIEFNNWIKEKLSHREFSSLVKEFQKTEAGRLSVPTLEHYLPFLYILGASDAQDQMHIEYDEMQNASISMLSVSFQVRS